MSARVEEAHRTCCCRRMRAAVRMYRMLAEEAVAELRRIEGQEGARSAPSRAADGLAGPGWHSGTPATGEARKSAESDVGLRADPGEFVAGAAVSADEIRPNGDGGVTATLGKRRHRR